MYIYQMLLHWPKWNSWLLAGSG